MYRFLVFFPQIKNSCIKFWRQYFVTLLCLFYLPPPRHRCIYFKLCLGPGVCLKVLFTLGPFCTICQKCLSRPVQSWKEFHFKSGLSSYCEINLFLNFVPSSDSENFEKRQMIISSLTSQSDQSPAGQYWQMSAPRKGFNFCFDSYVSCL